MFDELIGILDISQDVNEAVLGFHLGIFHTCPGNARCE